MINITELTIVQINAALVNIENEIKKLRSENAILKKEIEKLQKK